ncbi:spindle assembly abnormal protein 6 homolog isoform X3 [Cherax quadricarinatus]|uniref:spindle assembly abnormal protein 6 homolog isoform X3 n=1 Tax=Cherax quadricarinatus TaxID=27406 RepID=UPI00387E8FD9
MEACRSNTSDVLLNGDVLVRVVEAGVTIATATTRNLKMLVELKVRPSASSKEFLVRLTDDHDPFVLYTCVVHEDDYHTLRHTQGLLVDFNSFPHKFVELVNACHKENGKESPRFILVLRCSNDSEGGATLEVVEVNVFKHLCHLALALVPAPTQLKLSYLAECCKALKVQSDADRKADRVRRDLEARKNNQIEQLQSKIVSLTSQNNELLEKKQRAESNVKELRGRLSCAEGDLDRCRQELAHTKKHSTRLEQENCTKNAAVRELEVKVSHLEGELRSREISLAHVQQMVETLQHQKGNLEEGLEERRQKLLKRENSIQLLYAELQKSLDVIKKLQKRVKEEHMTSKVRGAALVEQDKVVAEKDSSVLQLSEQLQLMTTKVSQLTMDNGNLQQQLQDAREKLQEQEKTLQTNENVISWLNKQLNEVEVTGAIAKRAPLTEIYLTSQGPSSHGTRQPGSRFPSGSPGLVAHSTPLSNTLRSLTTVNSGWSGQTHTTVSSVRTLGNIPPIPEEISPRTTDKSPAEKDISPIDKENLEGLDPKYFEVTNPASVPVQGLLRANYCNTSPPDSHPKELRKDKTLEKRRGMIEGRGRGNRGRSSGRGGKGLESQKKTGVSNSHASSYFPRN